MSGGAVKGDRPAGRGPLHSGLACDIWLATMQTGCGTRKGSLGGLLMSLAKLIV